MNLKKNNMGFTMLELLGAVAVILVLAGIAIMSVGKVVLAGQASAVAQHEQILNGAYQRYVSTGGVPAAPGDTNGAISTLLAPHPELYQDAPYINEQPPDPLIVNGVALPLTFKQANLTGFQYGYGTGDITNRSAVDPQNPATPAPTATPTPAPTATPTPNPYAPFQHLNTAKMLSPTQATTANATLDFPGLTGCVQTAFFTQNAPQFIVVASATNATFNVNGSNTYTFTGAASPSTVYYLGTASGYQFLTFTTTAPNPVINIKVYRTGEATPDIDRTVSW